MYGLPLSSQERWSGKPGSVLRVGEERLAEHQVQVDGALWGSAGAVDGLIHGRQDHRRVDVGVGSGQVEAPADVVAEDIRLVYGLVGAGLAQFGWTVGGEQDHGHAVGRGLHDGGKAVGDRRARGRDPGRRTSRGARVTEGCEGGPALVEVDEATGSFVRGERRDQGGRARAGGDAEKVYAAAEKLFDDQARPEAISSRRVPVQARTSR